LLEADASGYQIQLRKVEYDHQRVIDAAQALKHPAFAIIQAFLSGRRQPFWA